MSLRHLLTALPLALVVWSCGDVGEPPAGRKGIDAVDPGAQQVALWHQYTGAREEALQQKADKIRKTIGILVGGGVVLLITLAAVLAYIFIYK